MSSAALLAPPVHRGVSAMSTQEPRSARALPLKQRSRTELAMFQSLQSNS